jgi:hypothetical protein
MLTDLGRADYAQPPREVDKPLHNIAGSGSVIDPWLIDTSGIPAASLKCASQRFR